MIYFPSKTMTIKNITLSLLIILCSFSVQAKMYKCTDSKGSVSYSDSLCKEGQNEERAVTSKERFAKRTVVTKGANITEEVGLIEGVPLGPHIPDAKGSRMGFIGYGIDSEHPQIKGLVIGEKDFTGEGLKPSQSQGTINALIAIKTSIDIAKSHASGSSNNDKLPPLVSAKVIGKSEPSNQEMADRLVKAIRWLSEMQVFTVTINQALPNGKADYSTLCREIERQDKLLFIISAGEPGQGSIVYPQACKTSNKLVVGTVTNRN
jgi:Domain of unknown function (DUF4124)